MPETQPSSPQGANLDPWRKLRALNDLDLGALAHKTGNIIPAAMLGRLPVRETDRVDAGYALPNGWLESCEIIATRGARIRASLPPAPDAELDALSAFLGQPRGRLM